MKAKKLSQVRLNLFMLVMRAGIKEENEPLPKTGKHISFIDDVAHVALVGFQENIEFTGTVSITWIVKIRNPMSNLVTNTLQKAFM